MKQSFREVCSPHHRHDWLTLREVGEVRRKPKAGRWGTAVFTGCRGREGAQGDREGFIRETEAKCKQSRNTFQDGGNNAEPRTFLSFLWAEKKMSRGKQEDQEENYSIYQK